RVIAYARKTGFWSAVSATFGALVNIRSEVYDDWEDEVITLDESLFHAGSQFTDHGHD
ncbi:hypothetical protein FRC09_017158, partial [Ceratobasidium sp. 395]